jgi:hypothetical protein
VSCPRKCQSYDLLESELFSSRKGIPVPIKWVRRWDPEMTYTYKKTQVSSPTNHFTVEKFQVTSYFTIIMNIQEGRVGGREGVFFMPLHSITWNEKRTSKCEA